MNLVLFTPLVVAIAVPLYVVLTRTDNRREHEGGLVFRWHPADAFFVLCGGIALPLFLGFVPRPRAIDDPLGRLVMLVVGLLCILPFPYILRFRVVVADDSIRAGAFFPVTLRFSEIVQATFAQGRQRGQIILRARDGRKIRIQESIAGFGPCARAIAARLPEGVVLPDTGRMHAYLHPDGR